MKDNSALMDFIRARVGAHLNLPVEAIDPDRPLAEYGLDSVSRLAICGEIEDHMRTTVEPTLLWEHESVRAISDHLTAPVVQARIPRLGDRSL